MEDLRECRIKQLSLLHERKASQLYKTIINTNTPPK